VVVLIDIDSYVEQDNDELLYVGLTRARLHLVVVGAKATLATLGRKTEALMQTTLGSRVNQHDD